MTLPSEISEALLDIEAVLEDMPPEPAKKVLEEIRKWLERTDA